MKLFEVIAAQETYCEEKVKALLKNEKLVGYFSRAKRYLYDKILDSMRLYHAEKNIKSQLWRQYEDACFLFSRKHYKMAARLLQKIKTKAEASECWLIYVEALRLETLLDTECKDMIQVIEDWDKTFDEALQKTYNAIHFMLVYRLFSYYWNVKTIDNTQVFYSEFHTKYLDESKSPLKPITTEAQIYYQNTLSIYHKAFKKFDLSYQDMEKVLVLFEKKECIMEKKQMHYFYALENLISIDCERFNEKKALLNIQKVEKYFFVRKSLVFQNIFLKINILTYHHFNKLVYCLQFALHEEALNTIRESIEISEKHSSLISEIVHVLLAQMYMLIYIVHEQWEEAFYWIDFILSKNPKTHRSSFVNAQLWQLVIHMEFKNYQLLESMLRNTTRMWKQEKLYTDFHKELIKIFRHQVQEPYLNFWSDVSTLALNHAQKEKFQGVDTLHSFAQSRIRGQQFKTVRKELVREMKDKHSQNKYELIPTDY